MLYIIINDGPSRMQKVNLYQSQHSSAWHACWLACNYVARSSASNNYFAGLLDVFLLWTAWANGQYFWYTIKTWDHNGNMNALHIYLLVVLQFPDFRFCLMPFVSFIRHSYNFKYCNQRSVLSKATFSRMVFVFDILTFVINLTWKQIASFSLKKKKKKKKKHTIVLFLPCKVYNSSPSLFLNPKLYLPCTASYPTCLPPISIAPAANAFSSSYTQPVSNSSC